MCPELSVHHSSEHYTVLRKHDISIRNQVQGMDCGSTLLEYTPQSVLVSNHTDSVTGIGLFGGPQLTQSREVSRDVFVSHIRKWSLVWG